MARMGSESRWLSRRQHQAPCDQLVPALALVGALAAPGSAFCRRVIRVASGLRGLGGPNRRDEEYSFAAVFSVELDLLSEIRIAHALSGHLTDTAGTEKPVTHALLYS